MVINVMHTFGCWGIGGAEVGALRLIRSMRSDHIHHSLCILKHNGDLSDLPHDIDCHIISLNSNHLAFLELCRLYRKTQTHICHVNNLSPWLDAVLAARLAGCKCLLTFHGVENSNLKFSNARRLLWKISATLSPQITAVSNSTAESFRNITGLTNNTCIVIENGVDVNLYRPFTFDYMKRSARKAFGFPEDALIIGCVAGLRPVKNHRGLLEAFADTITNVDTSHMFLILVGDGPLSSDLRILAQNLSIQNNILFLGNRNDVHELLPCFDLFVLNSHTEGMPYAILEAMASGLPIIATNVGANAEIIDDHKCGLLVPKDDTRALSNTLSYLFHNTSLLSTFGDNSRRKIINQYTLNNTIQKYNNLYQAILHS